MTGVRRLAWSASGIGLIALAAMAAPLLPLADPVQMDVAHRLAAPGFPHLLGQDEYGRDVLARLLWEARVSLSVALSASLAACLLGTPTRRPAPAPFRTNSPAGCGSGRWSRWRLRTTPSC